MTIPHSGEKIPLEASWLNGLPETVVMCDVDRFVDKIYETPLNTLQIPSLKTEWHRYVVDLNRLPEDVDSQSVEKSLNPPGSFTTGLHWVQTTTHIPLMKKPITQSLHNQLVKKYFLPFHQKVEEKISSFKKNGAKEIFHLDVHSMPSLGTSAHRDPGELRAEIVVSDFNGKSSGTWFKDLVVNAYTRAGFNVAYNWPYIGGRLTQQYGQPHLGQHTLQVELRRNLYMDEESKKAKDNLIAKISGQIHYALKHIVDTLEQM
ncbi:MAG: N-formylglutamate amidohydrolase [Bdellovibrionales bacterium]|nr:N-formylglutamate amidohydrolase [Bdellovibrionales bacterium]